VISPEGGASLLLRDAARAKDAAAMLRITSADLLEFKVINGIIGETGGGAHQDPEGMAKTLKELLVREVDDLARRNPSVLVRYRNQKIRRIGHFHETADHVKFPL
jgi:acetyl-CoA carboxylase carboxyl transferase subunit alpha